MRCRVGVLGILGLFAMLVAGAAMACPFCSAVSRTFSQEIQGADVAVIAELVELPPSRSGSDGGFAPGLSEPLAKSQFKIVESVKGADLVKDIKEIEANYLGDASVGRSFSSQAQAPSRSPGRRRFRFQRKAGSTSRTS